MCKPCQAVPYCTRLNANTSKPGHYKPLLVGGFPFSSGVVVSLCVEDAELIANKAEVQAIKAGSLTILTRKVNRGVIKKGVKIIFFDK